MWILYFMAAIAGQIIVDGKVPMAIALDGQVVAQTWREGRVTFDAAPGLHTVTLTVRGNPKKVEVVVDEFAPAMVLVGKSGISVSATAPVDDSVGAPEVRFRVTGKMSLMVQVGNQRVVVPPGDGIVLPLELGVHEMSVRSANGTAVFARGKFEVSPSAEPVIVQLTQGALPETSGVGVSFYPDRS